MKQEVRSVERVSAHCCLHSLPYTTSGRIVALPQPRDGSVVFAGWRQCAPHNRIYRKPKMFAMATSVFAGYRQYLHFVGRPLKPPACLVAVVHTKPLIASLVPKLVAMATSLRQVSAISAFCRPTT